MTQAAPLERKLKDPDNLEISLALICKIGQVDQAKAIIDLELFSPSGLAPEYRLYYEALACEIRIRAGDMVNASPHCEKTRIILLEGVNDPVVEALGHNAIGYYVVSQGKP